MPQTKMQISVQCFHCDVDDELREHCEAKLSSIERMWDNAQRASVRLGGERGRFSAEITLVSDGLISRAEERGDDLRAAFDAAVSKLQRQLSEFKKKAQSAQRRHNNRDDASGTVLHPRGAPDIELAVATNGAASAPDDLSDAAAAQGESVDEDSVVRIKRFTLKPMSPEEASLQMDLLGHSFFVFRDDKSNEVSVVYRRHSGGYGLIEPVSD